MSNTPRADAVWKAKHYEDGALEDALYDLAKQLERELNEDRLERGSLAAALKRKSSSATGEERN